MTDSLGQTLVIIRTAEHVLVLTCTSNELCTVYLHGMNAPRSSFLEMKGLL